jgi:hypothetical protein
MKKQKKAKNKKPNTQEERALEAQTTVSQWRLPIFKASLRTNGIIPEVIFEGKYGRCTIRNCCLTQTHRNILDAIFSIYESKNISNEGDFTLFFNARKLFKAIGVTPNNHKWLKKKLDEMFEPVIEIKANYMERTVHSVIISEHSYTDPMKKFKKGNLYYIRLTRSFIALFFYDMPLRFRNDIFKKIISYKSGVLQAFIRFCLTHKQLNTPLNDILHEIMVFTDNTSEDVKKIIRLKILKYSEQLYSDFGIKISSGIVFYEQHNDIFIEEPVDVKFLPAIKSAGTLSDVHDVHEEIKKNKKFIPLFESTEV